MNGTSESPRFTLLDLPVAARLTLAAFLASVGIGYFSALVQLHFQHAQPGEMMPTGDDAVRVFSHPSKDQKALSKLERLLIADEKLSFNGSGQMSSAFTTRSSGWKRDAKRIGEDKLRKQREGEREGVLAWLRAGADKDAYEKDRFSLPADVAKGPITAKYVEADGDTKVLKIKTLLEERCVRCHTKDGAEDAKAEQYPLQTYEQIKPYTTVNSGGAMELRKLAQTTHVHMLGFAVLYGLTGLILAFTTYPAAIRVPLAPLPLVAQVVDISLWWLARLDEPYGHMLARGIPITGAIVGASLGLQLLLSLFDLFGRAWKISLFVVICLTIGGGLGLKQKVIDPHLTKEKGTTPAMAKE
jgi:hypothetical protein